VCYSCYRPLHHNAIITGPCCLVPVGLLDVRCSSRVNEASSVRMLCKLLLLSMFSVRQNSTLFLTGCCAAERTFFGSATVFVDSDNFEFRGRGQVLRVVGADASRLG